MSAQDTLADENSSPQGEQATFSCSGWLWVLCVSDLPWASFAFVQQPWALSYNSPMKESTWEVTETSGPCNLSALGWTRPYLAVSTSLLILENFWLITLLHRRIATRGWGRKTICLLSMLGWERNEDRKVGQRGSELQLETCIWVCPVTDQSSHPCAPLHGGALLWGAQWHLLILA